MSYSLRQHAGCVGVSGNFSVLRDVLGMRQGELPTDDAGGSTSVSMRTQMDAIKGQHIHINIIRVGLDLLSAAEMQVALRRIDFAVLRCREIFRQANLGVGRVQHYFVHSTDADGLDDIGSDDDESDLWDGWSVRNDGLDVFIVRTISAGHFGRSPIDGNCDKSGKRSGLVGSRIDHPHGGDGVARTLAHEIGHFLGLSHNHGADSCPASTTGQNRLMAQTGCAISVATSTNLNNDERSTMREHCSVRGGC